MIFAAGAGITLVPIVPVGFAFATELTHPVAPAMVIGLITTFSNILLFGVQFAYLAILSNGNIFDTRVVLIMFSLQAGLAFLASLGLREDLRRLDSVVSMSMAYTN